MTSNFRKIGDFISVIDNRNTDGSVTNLKGISIDKCYIPSVANVIGTNLNNYKIIRKGQFACSLMQVSRDQRIPIAMYENDVPAIMSPAYVMFEVSRPEELLPEYVELWFKRAEFDREASFYAVGGVRGSLDWEDFCKMEFPVPPLLEQRKIVHGYQVITDRIELLRKMNVNLEELAVCLYKQYFVLDGKVDLWNKAKLDDLAVLSAGGDVPELVSDIATEKCHIPIIGNAVEKEGLYGFTHDPKIMKESVTVSARGSNIGFVCLRQEPYYPIVRLISLIPKKGVTTAKFIYLLLKTLNIFGSGSSIPQLTVPDFKQTDVYLPDYEVIEKYTNMVNPLYNIILQNKKEMDTLKRLSEIMSTKLAC